MEARCDFQDAPWQPDAQRDAEYWRRLLEICEAVEARSGKAPPKATPSHTGRCSRVSVYFYPNCTVTVPISRVAPQRTATVAERSREIVGPAAVMKRAFDRTSPGA